MSRTNIGAFLKKFDNENVENLFKIWFYFSNLRLSICTNDFQEIFSEVKATQGI